jgi:hypothetical protein
MGFVLPLFFRKVSTKKRDGTLAGGGGVMLPEGMYSHFSKGQAYILSAV